MLKKNSLLLTRLAEICVFIFSSHDSAHINGLLSHRTKKKKKKGKQDGVQRKIVEKYCLQHFIDRRGNCPVSLWLYMCFLHVLCPTILFFSGLWKPRIPEETVCEGV